VWVLGRAYFIVKMQNSFVKRHIPLIRKIHCGIIMCSDTGSRWSLSEHVQQKSTRTNHYTYIYNLALQQYCLHLKSYIWNLSKHYQANLALFLSLLFVSIGGMYSINFSIFKDSKCHLDNSLFLEPSFWYELRFPAILSILGINELFDLQSNSPVHG